MKPYGFPLNPTPLPFKLPTDIYVVILPTVFMCSALLGLTAKTLTADPEMSTMNYYDKPEAEVAKQAQSWNDGVKELFRGRIEKHKFGFFTNEVEAPKP